MHPLVWQKEAICESFLRENRIFHQFVKVFSLESFFLYGSMLTWESFLLTQGWDEFSYQEKVQPISLNNIPLTRITTSLSWKIKSKTSFYTSRLLNIITCNLICQICIIKNVVKFGFLPARECRVVQYANTRRLPVALCVRWQQKAFLCYHTTLTFDLNDIH